MSDHSEQVTALIKELLILNRAESSPAVERPIDKKIDGKKAKRRRIRQELVQALGHPHRKLS
jgi:hypothetical protein